MKRVIFGFIAVLTVFAMISCDSGGSKSTTKSDKAELTALKLDGNNVTLGAAITATEWASITDLSGVDKAGTFAISEDKPGAVIAATISAKAKAEYAKTDGSKPSAFQAVTSIDLADDTYISIKVTAENGTTVNYYVVKIESGDSNTSLTSVSIAGGPTAGRINGSYASTIAGVTTFSAVYLSSSANDGSAEVTLNLGSSFGGVATIAKVGKDATPAEADFTKTYADANKPTYTFTDEDRLYVKMTAANGTTVTYYGFKVLVGWDATLSTIAFSNNATNWTNQITVDALGTPQETLTDFPDTEVGKIQFKVTQPSPNGFYVKGVKNDPDQTVTISKDPTAITAAGDGTQRIFFAENDFLYIKVVPLSTSAPTKYYKIQIVLQRSVDIPYGSITGTVDAANPGVILTGGTDWLLINRANATEGSGWLDQDVADRSHGRAKLMWDEDGLWIYAEVWEKVVSASTGDYNQSSVELFINEAYPGPYTTNAVTGAADKNGGQYRLGANGGQTGPNTANTDAFIALGKANAVKVPSGMTPYTGAINDLDGGYKVLFQAPWRFPDLYPLDADKLIAIELQINATGSEGTRVGVLNWNNTSSNSYSSLADYGEATLKLPAGQALKPQKPVITTQPANKKIGLNATELGTLTVTANSVDQGSLGYQWYSATGLNDNTGTIIANADTATLTLTAAMVDTSAVKDFYFFVEVTNTKGGAANSKFSNKAVVQVYDPNAVTFSSELINDQRTGWDATKKGVVKTTSNYGTMVTLPFSKDLSKYSRLEVKYTITGGTVPTDVNSADLFIDVTDSTGAHVNVSGADGGYNNTNYNVSGFVPGGCYFNLANDSYKVATGGALAKIDLKIKDGVKVDGAAANIGKEIVITSALLISNDAIVLDLSKVTQTWSGSGQGGAQIKDGYADGKITWNFNDNTRAAVDLTADQIELLTDSDVKAVYYRVTGTSSTDANYRLYIANPGTGSDWNYTNASNNNADGKWSVIANAAYKLDYNGNPPVAARAKAFLVRAYATDVITITKIEIYPTIYE